MICPLRFARIDAERSPFDAQGGAVLTGHEDGMVRAWACDGSTSWKETDSARWKVQVSQLSCYFFKKTVHCSRGRASCQS